VLSLASSLPSQILAGIRVIKMYAWEAPFAAMVQQLRRTEVSKVFAANALKGFNLSIFFSATALVVFLTFLPYTLDGNRLDAYTVFYTIALFAAARFTIALKIPLATQGLSELRVAAHRIEKLLLLEDFHALDAEFDDVPETNPVLSPPVSGGADGSVAAMDEGKRSSLSADQHAGSASIAFTNVSCRWTPQGRDVLRHISLRARRGELVGVIGPVGSGKTSLLLALLGELRAQQGSVRVNGRVSYAPQVRRVRGWGWH
jgi:ABC-type multidrug transport system fused ATPase/permease subunit